VKVPIDVENDELREDDAVTEEAVEPEVEPEATNYDELTPEEEAAMVEAAKRAGAEAAEADMAAEVEAATDELKAQLDAATEEAEAAKKEAADASDRLLRLQAEWENYRRRTAQERLAERERAAERLVTNLLPVLDDMERASAHATQTAEGDEKVAQFVDGVMAVHAKMLDILAKENVEVIDPAGEPFDPLVHQAVGRQEDTEAYDESVAQVYQKGYRMGGKVIRPAMVTVTFGGPKRPAEEPAENEE
jgi:molecular chaperone GrpE